jgi:hypothetical protein
MYALYAKLGKYAKLLVLHNVQVSELRNNNFSKYIFIFYFLIAPFLFSLYLKFARTYALGLIKSMELFLSHIQHANICRVT